MGKHLRTKSFFAHLFFFNTFLGHNVFLGGNEAEKKNLG